MSKSSGGVVGCSCILGIGRSFCLLFFCEECLSPAIVGLLGLFISWLNARIVVI